MLARRPTRPLDFHRRIQAVREFRQRPESESLAAANKRIRNILRKTDEDIPAQIDADLLQDEAERERLIDRWGSVGPGVLRQVDDALRILLEL